MTELNSIAHLTTADSFDLVQAAGINSQGEIVGIAMNSTVGDPSYGYISAFSAVPCDSSSATDESCNRSWPERRWLPRDRKT